MTKIYDFILKTLKPFVIWFGGFHFPFTRKKITGKNYYEWRDKIKIGTVILTKTKGEFSNYINPTKIKHCGIYVGKILDDDVCYVLEAVGKGVVLTDLVTFLTTKDVAVGCHPNFVRNEDEFNLSVIKASKKFKGKPYDYLFKKGGDAFYCFELAAACLKSSYPELQLKCKEIVKGKRIYNHETYLDNRFFDIIFDSREDNGI